MYQYIGNMRLQLWFESPNICASFLVMTIMLTIGLFLCVIDKKTIIPRLLTIALMAAVFIQEGLLAMTYSRGGYVAFAAGIMFMWYFNRKRWSLFFLFSFVVIIFFTSNGVDRVHSIAKTGDGSIYHRLLLWKGGLSIIADNWLTGTDASGCLYTAWHQPLWLNEAYNSLISDYLAIGATYGILVLFAVLVLILTILACGIQFWIKTKSSLLLAVLAAIAAYMVSAVFSTFYSNYRNYWLPWALLLATLCTILYSLIFRRFRPSFLTIVVPYVCAAFFCLSLLVAGWILNWNIPYSVKNTVFQNKGKEIKVCEAYPKIKHKAVIIYLFNPENEHGFFNLENKRFSEEIRSTVRPLLTRNYAVIVAGVDSGIDGASVAAFILKKVLTNKRGNEPVFLAGAGDGGKQAIIAAAKVDATELGGVIALGTPASWPYDEISPILHIQKLKAPLLLIHGELDSTYPATESLKLKKFCDENKIPAECKIIKGVGAQFSNHRELVLNMIDKFVLRQIASAADNPAKALEMQLLLTLVPSISKCKCTTISESIMKISDWSQTEYSFGLLIYSLIIYFIIRNYNSRISDKSTCSYSQCISVKNDGETGEAPG